MYDRILVLGNGFDLDLGLNTRFLDFAKSSYWPFQNINYNPNAELPNYLNKFKENERWFDLEFALRNYVIRPRSNYPNKERGLSDKKYFDELVASLNDYLLQEVTKPINTNSFAAQVLKAVVDNGKFKIYTFNYSPLNIFLPKIGCDTHITDVEYVHGSLTDKSIILGIDYKVDIIPGYEYMRKSYNAHYKSHPIYYDLKDAKEIIFFGLSFGSIDYSYFSQFFIDQSVSNLVRKDSKYIRIFTFNDDSRNDVLDNLREMNEKNSMFGLNDLQIVCTQNHEDKKELNLFLQKMKDESKNSDSKKFDHVVSSLY